MNSFKGNCYLISFYIMLIIFTTKIGYSANVHSSREAINILTWWGYLDSPEIINLAERKCNVSISFDEYFSNDEFLRRWEGQKEYYDVIIFADTIFNIIKKNIPRFDASTLWKQSIYYNPVIKIHYKKLNYPHNIVYFTHSMAGFLWNPNNIRISKEDSIVSIFGKANKKLVALIDDPVEESKLIEQGLRDIQKISGQQVLTIANFKKIIQEANVYITNNYAQIYKKPDFAFSFSWSGEAVFDKVESNKKYNFLIHPKVSYISSDLIAQTSKKRGALCVARFLSSKETISRLQIKDFYFSPYTDYSKIHNNFFKEIYRSFVKALPTLHWKDSVNKSDFEKINQSWQLIKLSLNNIKGI